MNMKTVIGIDIAKKSFDVCISDNSDTFHFENSAKGFAGCSESRRMHRVLIKRPGSFDPLSIIPDNPEGVAGPVMIRM
ncbi:hypothetical protein [Pantoea stewartii]|uniref:hypothetical protein n=1 Tax=Pantoea stewartii TaxID=66269 RepID=UPI003241CA02